MGSWQDPVVSTCKRIYMYLLFMMLPCSGDHMMTAQEIATYYDCVLSCSGGVSDVDFCIKMQSNNSVLNCI